MPVTFIRGDITKLKVDAIVNAANNQLRGGGGVDGAIHAAAGAEQLHAFCKTLGGCPTGEAKLSPAFNLPAKFIIHTVGPVWQCGAFHEKTLLTSCYLRSLELAQQNHCKTAASVLSTKQKLTWKFISCCTCAGAITTHTSGGTRIIPASLVRICSGRLRNTSGITTTSTQKRQNRRNRQKRFLS